MANQEQLNILAQGVEAWNQWQRKQPSLTQIDLRGADFSQANLSGANLSRAYLPEADLTEAILREANLSGAILSQGKIYGISAWSVELKEAKQKNLVITNVDEPTITVDNLKIAQFIYLLLTEYSPCLKTRGFRLGTCSLYQAYNRALHVFPRTFRLTNSNGSGRDRA
jgi:nitrogen fixation protein